MEPITRSAPRQTGSSPGRQPAPAAQIPAQNSGLTAAAGQAEQFWKDLTTSMGRFPVATFLTGLGLGFVLARLRGSARPVLHESAGPRLYTHPARGDYPFAK